MGIENTPNFILIGLSIFFLSIAGFIGYYIGYIEASKSHREEFDNYQKKVTNHLRNTFSEKDREERNS